MPLADADVRAAIAKLVDPNTGKDFVSTRSVKGVKASAADVQVDIELGYPGKTQYEPIRRDVIAALKQALGGP